MSSSSAVLPAASAALNQSGRFPMPLQVRPRPSVYFAARAGLPAALVPGLRPDLRPGLLALGRLRRFGSRSRQTQVSRRQAVVRNGFLDLGHHFADFLFPNRIGLGLQCSDLCVDGLERSSEFLGCHVGEYIKWGMEP